MRRAAVATSPGRQATTACRRVLLLTHLDVRTGVGLNALDGGRVGTALVNVDLLGHTMQSDGLFKKAPCGYEIAWHAAQSQSCRRRGRPLDTDTSTGLRP